MDIFDRLDQKIDDVVKGRKDRSKKEKLHRQLNGIYALIGRDKEFTDDEKLNMYDAIEEIVRDENF